MSAADVFQANIIDFSIDFTPEKGLTMTAQQAMNLAKEKLGKDITAQEAKDYLSGKTALPDEALSIVSGGMVNDVT